MSVKVNIPAKSQETSVGRRLFSMAAPLVGSAFGPVGAVVGNVLGSKAAGASNADTIIGAAKAGVATAAKEPAAPASNKVLGEELPQLQKPELGESAFGRRLSVASQNPQVGLQEGLNALSVLPPDHPMRQQYTEPLVKASYLAGRKF